MTTTISVNVVIFIFTVIWHNVLLVSQVCQKVNLWGRFKQNAVLVGCHFNRKPWGPGRCATLGIWRGERIRQCLLMILTFSTYELLRCFRFYSKTFKPRYFKTHFYNLHWSWLDSVTETTDNASKRLHSKRSTELKLVVDIKTNCRVWTKTIVRQQ